jgi:hypothetical protein
MKYALIVLLLIASCAFGAKSTESLPPEVARFVADRDICDHFGGEEDGSGDRGAPDQKERQQFVHESEAIYCSGTDKRLAALRSRYKDSPTVIKKLQGYESHAYIDCEP